MIYRIIIKAAFSFALIFTSFFTVSGITNFLFASEPNSPSILGIEDNLVTDGGDSGDLVTVNEIISTNQLSNGFYEIEYKYTIQNNSNKTINELKFFSDFTASFIDKPFSIVSLSSNLLNVNQNFNGIDNLEILNGVDSLNAGESATIDLVIQFDPQGATGPFVNYINAEGKYEPTQNDDDEDGESGDDNNIIDEDDGEPAPDSPYDWLSLTLFDATEDEFLFDILDGDIVNVSDIPGELLNLIIYTNIDSQSALITFNNGYDEKVIEMRPVQNRDDRYSYLFEPWIGPDLQPWDYPLGEVNITIELFDQPGIEGSIVHTVDYDITFVREEPDDEGDDNATASDNSEFVIEETIDDRVPDSFPIIIDDPIVSPIDVPEIPPIDDFGSIKIIEDLNDEIKDEFPEVQGAFSNETGGRVLAATGSNITLNLIIGFLIIFAVFEMNTIHYEIKLKNFIVKLFS